MEEPGTWSSCSRVEERVQAGVVLVQKRRERLRSEFTHTLMTHEDKRLRALGGAGPALLGVRLHQELHRSVTAKQASE